MFIRSNKIKVHFEIIGEGEPLLIVHGWGGSIKSLSDLAKLLSKKYKIISVDLPGFGKSELPSPDFGVGEYAQTLIDVLKKLKITRVNYFGHSFGGSLGICIAVNHPQLINKLILCSSSYNRKNLKSNYAKYFKFMPQFLKNIIYRLVYPNSDIYRYSKLTANFKKVMAKDLTPLLDRIKIPTLILWGEKDKITLLNSAYELKSKIKKSRLKIFPGIGHNLPLKYPSLIYNEIIKFL